MPAAKDYNAKPVRIAGLSEAVTFHGRIPIVAAGAVASTGLINLPGFTAVNGGTGIYTVTTPTAADAFMTLSVKSAARTVVGAYQKASSPTAGTLSLETCAPGGAAANPASGDYIEIHWTGLRAAP
jgi:hypothetical protein